MMARRVGLLAVTVCLAFVLNGCLFSLNHPRQAADGTLVVFLERDGGYALVSEGGVLHLLQDGERVAVPAATVGEAGGLLDLSPDKDEALYVDIRMDGFFEPIRSTMYRVALRSDAAPAPVWETEDTIGRALWVDDERILLLRFGDEDLGTLEALDLVGGGTEWLARNVLSFGVLSRRNELILIVGDLREDPPLGLIVHWDVERDVRTTLASFVLSAATLESFLLLPHEFLWDIGADGSWIALCLYDGTLIDPMTESEVPSVYLIDVKGDVAQRIAVEGLMPTFSPDGTTLVYLTGTESDMPMAVGRDLLSEKAMPIPGTEGASTVFWLSPTTLGVTFEAGDDRYRLTEINPSTAEARDVFE
jgi:hypothetical protein